VNDTDDAWSGQAVVRRLRFDGTELAATAVAVDAPPRTTATIHVDLAVTTPEDPASEFLEVTLGDRRALWFFAEYRDSRLEAPRLEVVAHRADGGYAVTVTAANLVRDLALLVDKIDGSARVDDQLVTLLPGESVVFAVTTDTEIEDAAWSDPTILRSANQLVAKA
jgi:beta-mannosidase